MAGKIWRAGAKNNIPARAIAGLAVVLSTAAPAWALPSDLSVSHYLGEADPSVLWDAVIAGIVVCAFLASIAIWIHSALRRIRHAQLRRNVFISSALNNLSQGVIMTDRDNRVVFCNDRFLDIYGLSRAEIPRGCSGRDLIELRRQRGKLPVSIEEYAKRAREPDGYVTELTDGRSVLAKLFDLPNGGIVGVHEDCTEQRKLARQLDQTKQFLELVLDHVPVCVAAKNIQDGRYIFANRAFEAFSRMSRDRIVGSHASGDILCGDRREYRGSR